MRAEAAGDDQNWKSQNATDLTDGTRKLDEAQGDLTKASMRSGLVDMRADQDATVLYRAPVSVGSVLQSGDQLLKLVPSMRRSRSRRACWAARPATCMSATR